MIKGGFPVFRKPTLTCTFSVAGAGLEPATSGLRVTRQPTRAPTWGPRARAGDGLSDEYSTTDTPDSVDELSSAALQGLPTTEQRMQLATAWAAAETGDGPAQRAGTWKPPTLPKG